MKTVKPAAYRTPLKSATSIKNYLLDYKNRPYQANSWQGDGQYLFCWNVKCGNVNLDFDNLLKIWLESCCGDHDLANNPEWIEKAQKLYEEHQKNLFDWGLEGARNSILDTDTFFMTWEGKKLNVQYGFCGRSQGWFVIEKFNNCRLRTPYDLDYWCDEHLRDLYALIRILEHDITREKACEEVEYRAAFDFFVNICADIELTPSPEANKSVNI